MIRKIYSAQMIEMYRKNFVNTHAKFIHHSPLHAADLDKEFVVDGKTFKLEGINDQLLAVVTENGSKNVFIMELKDVKKVLN